MTKDKLQKHLTEIASKHLFVDNLETQNSDSSDFHEVSVWGIEAALKAAFELGQKGAA